MPWTDEAKAALDAAVESQPVLVRISAAKRLRDAAEQAARKAGEPAVTLERLQRIQGRRPAAIAS